MKRVWLALPIPVAFLVFIIVTGGMSQCVASCDGYKDELIARVEACPKARAALGDNIKFKKLSYACGQSETSGGAGNASWDIALTGSKASGRLAYSAEKHGGNWVFTSMSLDVDDQTIDVLACANDARTEEEVTSMSFDGVVLRSTLARVDEGATCHGSVQKAESGTSAKMIVHCGGALVYDGAGTFEASAGMKTADYSDPDTSDKDHTPACKMKGAGQHGTLTVWDIGATPFEVVVSL